MIDPARSLLMSSAMLYKSGKGWRHTPADLMRVFGPIQCLRTLRFIDWAPTGLRMSVSCSAYDDCAGVTAVNNDVAVGLILAEVRRRLNPLQSPVVPRTDDRDRADDGTRYIDGVHSRDNDARNDDGQGQTARLRRAIFDEENMSEENMRLKESDEQLRLLVDEYDELNNPSSDLSSDEET